jgi:pyruvate dehydrogenase E2 component (dihydrolipoamide acetyltransferase)
MTLPKVGVNMTEAVVMKWLVGVGDTIREGDPIMEAETDKATQEIQSTGSGVVAKLIAAEGQTVQCHEPILELAAEDEQPAAAASTEAVKEPAAKVATVPEPAQPAPVFAPAETAAEAARKRISPLAKKIAREKGIDWRQVEPSVPGGRVVLEDVLAYKGNAAQPERQSAQGDERIPLSSIRKVIAARMRQSALEKPTVALTISVNAEAIIALRSRSKGQGNKISVDAILTHIAAKALQQHRIINSVLEGDAILLKKDIHIGVAVDTPKGLMVPVVKHADTKDIAAISTELEEMVAACKEGRIGTHSITGGTFTITSLGMFGVAQFTPIINPPECCILGIGAFRKVFVPDENDQPVLATEFYITLVFDHRIVDGAPAAEFLRTFKEYAEALEMQM